MSNARDKANIPSLNFSSTGIDDNATSTAITIDSYGKAVLGKTTVDGEISKLQLFGTSGGTGTGGQLGIQGSETTGAINTGGSIAFKGHNGSGNRNFGTLKCQKENSTVGSNLSYMSFATRDASGLGERMRIDSSGNFLYAKTTTDTTTTGVEFRPSGLGYFGRSGGQPIIANRNTNDGTIIELRKDGTTVGNIGTQGGTLEIGSGDVYLQFNGVNDWIKPVDGSGNNKSGVDLGTSGAKFDNLYLGGNIYLGGTGSANALDDYETGYFEPNIQPASGSITWDSTEDKLSYTKIGRLVHITGTLKVSSVSSPSGITRGSLPFTLLNQDEQSERTTGFALVVGALINQNNFAFYPNGGSDTFLEIIRTNSTSMQRDAGAYFQSGTYIYVSYSYVSV